MVIDEVPEQQEVLPLEPPHSSHTGALLAVFVILVGVVVGEIYTLSKISALRGSVDAQLTQTKKDLQAQLQAQLSSSISDLQRSNARQLEAMQTEVEAATSRMGSTNAQLRSTKNTLAQVKRDQVEETEALQAQLAQKADQKQVGDLSRDVSVQRSDLDRTKQSVESVRADLGATRSEFGTLVARNHDEIEQLRKMGERDYFEFTLEQKNPQRVAGVGLTLTKSNVKRHRFNLTLTTDDMTIEKKDRTINEPIFFYVQGSRKPYELVVNGVELKRVKGYISTPKGAIQVAARSEGAR
jgi:multidrug efflux pump subunit AcrA (membrane-fusion protein)